MKIQFIIVGWHFDAYPEFIDQLITVNKNNDIIDIFWSCHKEPSDKVKENFDYKVFPNLGEEFIAYQQAIEYLNLDDDTICFFIHDDIIIKNWNFIISINIFYFLCQGLLHLDLTLRGNLFHFLLFYILY